MWPTDGSRLEPLSQESPFTEAGALYVDGTV